MEKVTRMKSKSILRSIVLLAVVALAVPVFAKPVSKTININQSATLGSAKLDAGEYRLLIDGNKATVHVTDRFVATTDVPDFLGQSFAKGTGFTLKLVGDYEVRDGKIAKIDIRITG